MGKKNGKKVINANVNVNDTNFSRTKITENAEIFNEHRSYGLNGF